MAVPPTDWKSRVGPLDAKTASGEPLVWPWMEGADDVVAVSLAAQLDPDEAVPSAPSCRLFRLRAFGEADDVEQNLKIVGPTIVNGAAVAQRLQNLERGRYYRLEFLHGPPGNRRGFGLLIRVQE